MQFQKGSENRRVPMI